MLLLVGAAAGQTFPPPRWAPTWNLTLSTVINPGITDGFFAPHHSWGLISPDWSIAQGVWMRTWLRVEVEVDAEVAVDAEEIYDNARAMDTIANARYRANVLSSKPS